MLYEKGLSNGSRATALVRLLIYGVKNQRLNWLPEGDGETSDAAAVAEFDAPLGR